MKKERHETLTQYHPPIPDNPEVIADNPTHLYSVPLGAGIRLTIHKHITKTFSCCESSSLEPLLK